MNSDLNALRRLTQILCVTVLIFMVGCLIIFLHDSQTNDIENWKRQSETLLISLSEEHHALIRANKQIGFLEVHNRALTQRIKNLNNLKSHLRRPAQTNSVLAGRGMGMLDTISGGPWKSFRVTWYSPEEGRGNGLITATGAHVREHWTVAVDPRVIPLGSVVEVQFGDGESRLYHAEDTGSAIRGNRIDIFSKSRSACELQGVQSAMVRVLTPGT